MGQTTIDGVLRENEVVQFGGTLQVNANGFVIADPTDSTKKVVFTNSGQTTGTTATITLPTASGSLPTTASPTFTGTVTITGGLIQTSTTLPFIPPRMTTTQRDAIATPTKGSIIYNTSTDAMNYYDGAWQAFAKV